MIRAALRSSAANRSQEDALVSGGTIEYAPSLNDLLGDEPSGILLKTPPFIRRVDKDIHADVGVVQEGYVPQPLNKWFTGALDNDQIDVALGMRAAARERTEQNNGIRAIAAPELPDDSMELLLERERAHAVCSIALGQQMSMSVAYSAASSFSARSSSWVRSRSGTRWPADSSTRSDFNVPSMRLIAACRRAARACSGSC